MTPTYLFFITRILIIAFSSSPDMLLHSYLDTNDKVSQIVSIYGTSIRENEFELTAW